MNLDPTFQKLSSAAQRDQDIVELLQIGKRADAFDLVAERYESKVYRLCVTLLRDPVVAQDVAQESLIRVWRALATYKTTAALSTWIYAITRNRCLTTLANRQNELSLSDGTVEAEAESVAAPTSSTFQQNYYRLEYNCRGTCTTLMWGDHGGQNETCSTVVDGGSEDDAEGTVQIENGTGAGD